MTTSPSALSVSLLGVLDEGHQLVCVCVCAHVFVCVCAYVHVCVCTCMCVCVHVIVRECTVDCTLHTSITDLIAVLEWRSHTCVLMAYSA